MHLKSDRNMIIYLPWKQVSFLKYTEGKNMFLET